MTVTAAELSKLVWHIAPIDHRDVPIYCALASELPSHLQPPAGLGGYTTPILDVGMQSWLEARGEWWGRGYAFVLNDLDEHDDDSMRARLVAIACHEAAHWLTDPYKLIAAPDSAAEWCEHGLAAAIAGFSTDREPDMPPWLVHGDHGDRFIRCLVHVMARAEQLTGELIPDAIAYNHSHYGMRPLDWYRGMLRDEIDAFDETMTFADLRETPPPRAFAETWRWDVQAWFRTAGQTDTAIHHVANSLKHLIPVLS